MCIVSPLVLSTVGGVVGSLFRAAVRQGISFSTATGEGRRRRYQQPCIQTDYAVDMVPTCNSFLEKKGSYR